MKKNLFMLFVVLLTTCVFASCSKDDDDSNSGAASSLTMNGEAIKVKSIEGQYDPSTSFRAFSFWVNDVSIINTGVYIQGALSIKLDNLTAGNDITSKFGLLMEYNNGDESITDRDFRSGNLVIQSIDTSKKVLTLEFKNLKYLNNLKKEVALNGTLTIPYTILE